MSSGDKDRAEIVEEFGTAVNMTPRELEQWLGSEESTSEGSTGGARKDGPAAESRRATRAAGRSCSSCVSRWRYSLMNCGHDPLKR